jgi:hypothetical protein
MEDLTADLLARWLVVVEEMVVVVVEEEEEEDVMAAAAAAVVVVEDVKCRWVTAMLYEDVRRLYEEICIRKDFWV